MTEAADHVVRLPRWIPADEAARVLDVSPRTLRRRAAAGAVKRKREAGRALYLVPVPEADARPDDGRFSRPDGHRTSGQAAAVELLRSQLEAANVARIDAERRAAVAEYRATIAEAAAEITPDRVELLQAEAARAAMLDDRVAMLAASLDEARREAEALGAAMRKRYALIQRLAKTARSGRE